MNTVRMICEYWVGWQILDGLRGYLRGVWHRYQLWRYENRPTMAEYMERKQNHG